MSELLHWNSAQIKWTTGGYKLRMTHSLQKREALTFERTATQWLANRRVGSLWLEPMVRYEQAGGVRAELGQIEITGQSLLEVDADELATTLDDLAVRAEVAARQAEVDDSQRIGEFLEILHAKS